jgi:hypothetical protein
MRTAAGARATGFAVHRSRRPGVGQGGILAAALAVVCCIVCSVTLSAQGVDVDDELRAAREHGHATGVRTANCLIRIQGAEYLHDFCTFIPSDAKDGSFTLAARVNKQFLSAKIILSAPASKEGVAYWNGPDGGRAPLLELGPAHSEGACWRVDDASAKGGTRICAWNSKLAVEQPTPKEPAAGTTDFIYYGMRAGMYDAIVSRTGIDTDHARIVTAKSRDAAIIDCRSNHDFTAECIERTLRDAPTPILTADCSAGTFADALGSGDCDSCELPQRLKFLGRNPHSDQGPDFLVQYVDGGGAGPLDGSWASTYEFAIGAYALLCPRALERARATLK